MTSTVGTDTDPTIGPVPDPATDPLFVDLYELTMVDAFRHESMADDAATFSLFVRDLPEGRGYIVAAGLDDALRWLEEFHFDDEATARLASLGVVSDDFCSWLRGLRFTGRVRAVPEGTIIGASEPILEVDAPLAEAQLAETFLLNQITLQSNLATKAARCLHAADGRAVIDFALRRTHGTDAGMKLARVARIVGLTATSNVAGAERYGIAASGTMAHSFIQAHPDELGAFISFGRTFGDSTVLLVDTYDTTRGVARAIEAARTLRAEGTEIRGIRLDSGDLGALSRAARIELDAAGFGDVAIFVSGGLDEFSLSELVVSGAPIDGFGVGTSLGVARDSPALESVYKLVEVGGRPVRKKSTGKATWPGAKQIFRRADHLHDVLALVHESPPPGHAPLLEVVMDGGVRTDAGRADLADARDRFMADWALLPETARDLRSPVATLVEPSDALLATTARIDADLAE